MIRYKLTEPPSRFPLSGRIPRTVDVLLEASAVEDSGRVSFDGDPDLVNVIKPNLRIAGMGGYPIEEVATPRNLAYAMTQPTMRVFRAELIEGHEILGFKP
jgi:hypothetical protein